MKMPTSCAAWNCTTRFNDENRRLGITFHRFPKDMKLRRQWVAAVRGEGFTATRSSSVCSHHFRPEDFDMTGQTVRLRSGVVPSLLTVPAHLTRSVKTSKKTRKTLLLNTSQLLQTAKLPPVPDDPVSTKISETSKEALGIPLLNSYPVVHKPKSPSVPSDHPYALPSSHDDLRARLREALNRVESLEKEKRNMKDRERRAKSIMSGLLEELREQNEINKELKMQLDMHSDLPLELLTKQNNEYTKEQKDFTTTLYRYSPKAYIYLRKSLNYSLPHHHTLQRWMSSVDAEPSLNTTAPDELNETQEEDPAE